MIHVIKMVVLAAPVAVTFVDSVGYIARVDGKRNVYRIFLISKQLNGLFNQEHQCNPH